MPIDQASALNEEEMRRKAIQDALLAKFQAANSDTSSIDAAQDEARRQKVIAGIGEALQGFAKANSMSRGGAAPDPSIFRNINADAGQSVQDAIRERQQKIGNITQEMGIQSEAAKEFRDSTKLGIDIGKVGEEVRHNKASELNDRKNHDDAIKARAAAATIATESKKQSSIDKMAENLKNDLDPNKARGGNLAKSQANLNQADSLNQLYTESNGDIRNLDQRQSEEFAIGMNRLLSQSGVGATSQIKALVPSTARGDAKKLKEWLFGEPTGLDQTEFVSRMAETVKRERDLADSKVKEAQIQRLPAHRRLKELDPEFHQQILTGYGISPLDIDENGQYKGKKEFRDTTNSGTGTSSYPKTVRKGNMSATVSNAQEEKEAFGEGFK